MKKIRRDNLAARRRRFERATARIGKLQMELRRAKMLHLQSEAMRELATMDGGFWYDLYLWVVERLPKDDNDKLRVFVEKLASRQMERESKMRDRMDEMGVCLPKTHRYNIFNVR